MTMPGTEIEIEDPQEGDEEIGDSIRYVISSYGADMPTDGLVKRIQRGDIFIPKFQRNFVWSLAQASRFIESLLLGLPVPGIFLFKEPDTQKLMVVDGQQRLLTLDSFYKGIFNDRAFRLVGVSEAFEQQTYETLAPEDQRQLNDSILHSTIFQQNEPSLDRSSVYSVFERLNTGGTPLAQQEIRACVYRGNLNELLSDLAGNTDWQVLFGGSRNARKKDEEIILRFFALYFNLSKYDRPMKKFLNNFMSDHRELDEQKVQEFREIFNKTVQTTVHILTPAALRPERALNVSVADAVLVGLAHRLKEGPIDDSDSLHSAHGELMGLLRDDGLYTEDTTNKDRVKKRIEYARQAYASVP